MKSKGLWKEALVRKEMRVRNEGKKENEFRKLFAGDEA